MSESRLESPEVEQNIPTGALKGSTVVQETSASQVITKPVQVSTPVPTNVFMGTLQGTLGYNTDRINVLVENRYDTQ